MDCSIRSWPDSRIVFWGSDGGKCGPLTIRRSVHVNILRQWIRNQFSVNFYYYELKTFASKPEFLNDHLVTPSMLPGVALRNACSISFTVLAAASITLTISSCLCLRFTLSYTLNFMKPQRKQRGRSFSSVTEMAMTPVHHFLFISTIFIQVLRKPSA